MWLSHDTARQPEESSASVDLPPYWIAQSLIDTYFLHVHNQPYCYFQEENFRQKLADGLIPKYLVLAVLASALRFSRHGYFKSKSQQTMEAYAKEAWAIIVNEYLTDGNSPELSVVQTAALITTMDFSGQSFSHYHPIY